MLGKKPPAPLFFRLTLIGKVLALILGPVLYLAATFAVLLLLSAIYGVFAGLAGQVPAEMTNRALAALITMSAIIVAFGFYAGIRFGMTRQERASSHQQSS